MLSALGALRVWKVKYNWRVGRLKADCTGGGIDVGGVTVGHDAVPCRKTVSQLLQYRQMITADHRATRQVRTTKSSSEGREMKVSGPTPRHRFQELLSDFAAFFKTGDFSPSTKSDSSQCPLCSNTELVRART